MNGHPRNTVHPGNFTRWIFLLRFELLRIVVQRNAKVNVKEEQDDLEQQIMRSLQYYKDARHTNGGSLTGFSIFNGQQLKKRERRALNSVILTGLALISLLRYYNTILRWRYDFFLLNLYTRSMEWIF